MTKFKDFGGQDSDLEPVSFRLWGEDFDCLPDIQGSVLLELASAASGNSDGGQNSEVILDFFEKVLIEESYERFQTLIYSKDRIVKISKLADIISWLTETYADRPETQPEG